MKDKIQDRYLKKLKIRKKTANKVTKMIQRGYYSPKKVSKRRNLEENKES